MQKRDCLKFDHITVVARTLEEGTAYVENCLEIDMPNGGAHPRMGTHNKLLSLGDDSFLEIIAIDPDAHKPTRPRWFDLDRLDRDPFIATWVVGTKDIHKAIQKSDGKSGPSIEMTRGDLKWLISIADDGTLPMDGAFPTFIQWPEGEHPANHMIDLDCRLSSLVITHPQAETINALIGGEIENEKISFQKSDGIRIRAEIKTPKGIKVL